jgi:hypothetical protein
VKTPDVAPVRQAEVELKRPAERAAAVKDADGGLQF